MEQTRVGQALLRGLRGDVEELAELVVVGLDHEGLRLEGLEQKRARSVDDEADAAAGEAGHDDLIHVIRQALGDGTREDEGVTGLDAVEAAKHLVDLVVRDLGAHAVDDGHHDAVELDVDAREALLEAHEVARDARALKGLENVVTSEAGDDAEADGVNVELVQDAGDIDAVTATTNLFARGTVGEAHVERRGVHHVVDGRVEGNGVNQGALLPQFFADSSMTHERAPDSAFRSHSAKKLTSV